MTDSIPVPDHEGRADPDATGDFYEIRFDARAEAAKDAIWREIGQHLQQFLPSHGPVLDVACDRGYFIRNIDAEEKWAIDVRDMSAHLGDGIVFRQVSGPTMDTVLPNDHFAAVFMSNYLEHLPSVDAVLAQLTAARRVLRPGGRLVILQPNLRYTGVAYWDFIDHRTPLTERSLLEGCEAAGFRCDRLIVRYLPYTTKSRLPQRPWMVRAYLRFPAIWRVLGQQSLYVGTRKG